MTCKLEITCSNLKQSQLALIVDKKCFLYKEELVPTSTYCLIIREATEITSVYRQHEPFLFLIRK